jgi:predicted Zn-ribbon and HTH transcriptional regulator
MSVSKTSKNKKGTQEREKESCASFFCNHMQTVEPPILQRVDNGGDAVKHFWYQHKTLWGNGIRILCPPHCTKKCTLKNLHLKVRVSSKCCVCVEWPSVVFHWHDHSGIVDGTIIPSYAKHENQIAVSSLYKSNDRSNTTCITRRFQLYKDTVGCET